MSTCKDCKFWREGECGRLEWVPERATVPADNAAIYADALDDSGLTCGLKTGPDFGCIKFNAH